MRKIREDLDKWKAMPNSLPEKQNYRRQFPPNYSVD